VVGSCVYGVDVSGEAVERAKDRLRVAADVPGMTLPFLDGHIRQGNALIGASPELIESGVPDEAFRPADGDDRGYARSLRRANAKPDPGQATLFSEQGGYAHSNEALTKSLAKIGRLPGGALADDGHQAAEYRKWRDSPAFRAQRLVADAWCAAFAWAKTPGGPPAIVNRVLRDLRERGAEGILPETLAEIYRLRSSGSPPVLVQGGDSRRAKELALAVYDRMTEADAAGAEYETRIFPPPGDGPGGSKSAAQIGRGPARRASHATLMGHLWSGHTWIKPL
jgi:hypothetical protein